MRFATRHRLSSPRRASRKARLAASLAALALALVAWAGVSVAAGVTDAAPLRSSTSSTLGIFVENGLTDEEMQEAGLVGNDSNLGIFVTSAAGEDIVVTFMTQGSVYDTATLGYGYLLSAPPRTPEWTGPWEGEDDDPPAPRPVFGGWCVDEAGTIAYDFSSPVTREMTLYAAWDAGEKVDVTLHALGGGIDDPTGLPDKLETLTLTRYVESTYRSLPEPVRVGHGFMGWWTQDGRETGAWGAQVEASTLVGDVSRADHDLYARWQPNAYFVRYVNNTDMAGAGAQHEVGAIYGEAFELLSWADVQAQGFYAPSGKAFSSWNERPDGGGASHAAGETVSSLAAEAGAYVALYAQWVDDGTVDLGPFDVRFVYGDGATEDAVVSVVRGERVGEPETPRRAGYQFGGWCTDEAGEVPWSFETPVTRDLTLYARWDLRLDVTVPVSVAFAVDASTGEAAGPEAGRYALKSRTVRPVEVESLALESRQGELEAFFGLADGAGWEGALAETELSLAPAGADAIGLPLAGEEADGVWTHERPIKAEERASWRMSAFDYGALAADGAWQGGDPSARLPLALALSVSDDLEVLTGQEGPVPIARLKVTVSATP